MIAAEMAGCGKTEEVGVAVSTDKIAAAAEAETDSGKASSESVIAAPGPSRWQLMW